uniref:Uncharacterized protein n=1 Tax=Romanomermis culicivorax TaxID=13658 RepID=A0A915JZ21_ROMCU
MLKEIKDLTKVACLTICNNLHSISKQFQMMSVDNMIGDPKAEHHPKEAAIIRVAPTYTLKNTYLIYRNYDYAPPWEQHIHYNAATPPYITMPMDSSHTSSQSLEVPLALPVLPSTSAATMVSNLEACTSN